VRKNVAALENGTALKQAAQPMVEKGNGARSLVSSCSIHLQFHFTGFQNSAVSPRSVSDGFSPHHCGCIQH